VRGASIICLALLAAGCGERGKPEASADTVQRGIDRSVADVRAAEAAAAAPVAQSRSVAELTGKTKAPEAGAKAPEAGAKAPEAPAEG
jgi:hypothetical protein